MPALFARGRSETSQALRSISGNQWSSAHASTRMMSNSSSEVGMTTPGSSMVQWELFAMPQLPTNQHPDASCRYGRPNPVCSSTREIFLTEHSLERVGKSINVALGFVLRHSTIRIHQTNQSFQ